MSLHFLICADFPYVNSRRYKSIHLLGEYECLSKKTNFISEKNEYCHFAILIISTLNLPVNSYLWIVITLVIEDALLPSTEVIEFNNLFLGRLVIICKDAAVGVFAFPQVKLTIHPLLPLNHKTVCLPFPFLN